MPPQNILISLRCAPLHQDILHRWLDKRQYSIYTEKGKRATEQPLLPQSHFSAVDCFYRVFFAEPVPTQAFAATGEVDTSSFISTACTVLKSVICLIGAGVGVWGVVSLLEGYGNDNPGAKAQ